VKIDGQECSVERAYDLLAADVTLIAKLEATNEERDRLVTYTILRSHRDYLRGLEAVRGDH
jgi:hypothetical protein